MSIVPFPQVAGAQPLTLNATSLPAQLTAVGDAPDQPLAHVTPVTEKAVPAAKVPDVDVTSYPTASGAVQVFVHPLTLYDTSLPTQDRASATPTIPSAQVNPVTENVSPACKEPVSPVKL